ncbi:hypothetical protein LIER_34914 [Lithospermum erythrorhizon]|uniref:Uncharacterized protein n=1 Tax=Lithospermum erythrorhizon TaxID=34254 RepID=A0AAV3NG80_LITER
MAFILPWSCRPTKEPSPPGSVRSSSEEVAREEGVQIDGGAEFVGRLCLYAGSLLWWSSEKVTGEATGPSDFTISRRSPELLGCVVAVNSNQLH